VAAKPTLPGMAREVVSVESKIEQVTVYATGARVHRVARLRAPLPSVVRLDGLPLGVIDDTVRSEVEGAAVATAIRVGVDTPEGPARPEESDTLRAARRRVAVAETDVQRLHDALVKLAEAPLIEEDPADEPPAAWHAIVTARRELVAIRARREASLREQHAAARREHDDAQRALAVVIEREARESGAQAARLHEVRKYIELDLAAAGSAGDSIVRVEYQIAAARWAPSYVARLDPGGRSEPGDRRESDLLHRGGDGTRFELRAIVAQDSGEDWSGVTLRLSTAEPERFSELPELHPQKIGRRQQEPARRGFRPPPAGVDALYADYERSFRAPPVALPDDELEGGMDDLDLSEQVWDEETSRPRARFPTPPPSFAPPPASLPPPAALAKRSGSTIGAIGGAVAGTIAAPFVLAAQAMTRDASGGGGREERRRVAATPTATATPTPTPRLDYGNLRMAPPSSPERGRLVPAPPSDPRVLAGVTDALERIAQLPLPPGHVDEWAHSYDYAFASEGNVDVASDGAWHSIALTSRAGTANVRHVAVPREQADVFRVAAITNPFDGPLLPGPIDVYDRGQFLVTSMVGYTPPGGTVDVGLGVDPAVKIARNVEFHEEATGMLRGGLRLVHAIKIDVENLAPRAIELEVRERVPVTREGEDDVEVALGKIDPPWERFTPDTDAPAQQRLRGGYRWRVEIPAATKKLLRAGYEVKIAGKHELVGGNRREP
jgi:hypothetical protein